MDLKEHLCALEQRLLDPEVRQDHAALNALLADDFREFGASGAAWNKAEVIAGLKHEAFVPRTLSDVQLHVLADDVALLTYRCHCPTAHASLRSSIWRRGVEGWQMVFHQGTRVLCGA